MKAFATLFQDLDQTSSTNEKVHLMAQFFRAQTSETNAWTLYFLAGRKPKKLIGAARLRNWAEQETGAPAWLMDECYAAVGDTAEMIALILGAHRNQQAAEQPSADVSLGDWMSKRLLPLANEDQPEQRRQVVAWWNQLETNEIFIINKFLTGGLRVGVSETLVYRALAEVLELPRTILASRLLGNWTPSAEFYESLAAPADSESGAEVPHALPKPFCLAAPIEEEPANLGDIANWQLEWKWDGIRCQIVKLGTGIEIWSRGEERITDTFPDVAIALSRLPGDWILDGELVAGDWRQPGLFQDLQKRLGRKKPSAQFQKDHPVSYLAYDLLQENAKSWSDEPLANRRQRLETMLSPFLERGLGISPVLTAQTWEEAATLRAGSRARAAEGLMVKSKAAVYETGRKRGIWFKWKIDPLTVDAVLTAAQPGTGRRASLYTDYTFSIWREDELVPIAKAYSGLTDQEIRELDHWIRQNTTARFGPVRALKAERVFEIGFEGIAESTRHKSGIAVRFPRILRERTDKKPADADRVETVRALLDSLKLHHNQPLRSSSTKTESTAEPLEGQMLFDLGQNSERQ
jgi:DNA ligase-1